MHLWHQLHYHNLSYMPFLMLWSTCSYLQIHYLSSASDDGTDRSCEELGYKRLEGYDLSQKRWKHLTHLAEGNSVQEDMLDFGDELVDDDYYAGLPFAALFSCCKVIYLIET